ncbi:MAG: YfiR family protein [Acidobacteria bacterium]|nr:YfiR family protein [Acidobacteriota bacterium]MBI3661959.1 YfiR family protein [Acidobacteriota bacterium]
MARGLTCGGRLRRALPWLLAACALGWAAPARAQADTREEYQVKAAFLFNFAKFIEWPDTAFSSARAPLVICVTGRNPFGNALTPAGFGKAVNGRPLQIWETRDIRELRGCHILFISPSEKKRMTAILESVKGAPVVTVSEADTFTQMGGMIHFLSSDDQVRFEINQDVGQHAGIKFSSKLLSVAQAVQPATVKGSQ